LGGAGLPPAAKVAAAGWSRPNYQIVTEIQHGNSRKVDGNGGLLKKKLDNYARASLGHPESGNDTVAVSLMEDSLERTTIRSYSGRGHGEPRL
jgi:hypothetical protein